MRSSMSTRWLVITSVIGATFAFGLGGCSSSSTNPPPQGDAGSTTDAAGGQDSGSTTDAGSGDGGLTAAVACAEQAHAVCSLRSSCSMTYNINKNFPDEATCETRTTLTCISALAATGTGQTPAAVAACSAAYPNEACTDYFDGNPVAACVPPAGTLQTGAPCGASGQCASTFCAIAQYQVCGTCQPLPAVGATCQDTADCGRNLACAVPTGATSGKCATYAAASAPCLTGVQPCAAGLACVKDDPATATMGTCQTAGATVGTTCDSARQAAASCNGELGLVCIPGAKGSTMGSCQSYTLVAANATCGDVGAAPITGIAQCEAGGSCIKQLLDGGATAPTGICAAPAADGAACDTDNTKGPPCLGPAKCVPSSAASTAGTCTVPDATKCM